MLTLDSDWLILLRNIYLSIYLDLNLSLYFSFFSYIDCYIVCSLLFVVRDYINDSLLNV